MLEESFSELERTRLEKLQEMQAQGIDPYPTQAEAIRKAGDAFNRTRLTPWVKRMLEAWLKWQRRG